VEVIDGDISAALKTFKTQVEAAHIQRVMRRRAHHSKPSEIRKVKSRIARARNQKAEKREQYCLARQERAADGGESP